MNNEHKTTCWHHWHITERRCTCNDPKGAKEAKNPKEYDEYVPTHAELSQQPVQYNSFSEIPADVLAHRVVGSLIEQKGNLNMYKAVIQRLIEEMRAEAPKRESVDEVEHMETCECCQSFLAMESKCDQLKDVVCEAITNIHYVTVPYESYASQLGAGVWHKLDDTKKLLMKALSKIQGDPTAEANER